MKEYCKVFKWHLQKSLKCIQRDWNTVWHEKPGQCLPALCRHRLSPDSSWHCSLLPTPHGRQTQLIDWSSTEYRLTDLTGFVDLTTYLSRLADLWSSPAHPLTTYNTTITSRLKSSILRSLHMYSTSFLQVFCQGWWSSSWLEAYTYEPEGLGGCSPPNSGKAIIFGQKLNFSGEASSQKWKNIHNFVFIKRKKRNSFRLAR